jgi:NAD(P)-dependent dehydrogenase (short-subunit alcohol dehydrogenase family)
MQQLDGKVAVITGAGSGIGASVARACAHEGMDVAVVDIDGDRAAAVASEIHDRGRQAESFVVDVSDFGAVDALAASVFERFGGCHLLHNNAGVCPVGRAWDHSAEEWRHVVGINLIGVVNGVTAFAPRLVEQGEEAHVVNTASAAALRFVPSSALYNTTKFAVLGYTESVRHDLAPYGIGVSALCPGGVDTNISETLHGTVGPRRDEAEVGALLTELATVDPSHVTVITPDQAAALVLEGVRNNDAYIITHPGSRAAVAARATDIDSAYAAQAAQHPELP